MKTNILALACAVVVFVACSSSDSGPTTGAPDSGGGDSAAGQGGGGDAAAGAAGADGSVNNPCPRAADYDDDCSSMWSKVIGFDVTFLAWTCSSQQDAAILVSLMKKDCPSTVFDSTTVYCCQQ